MNPNTLAMAALAALCLLPAASANTPNDPWGPDVSVTVDLSNNARCEAADHELGPLSVSEQDGDACAVTVAYDGQNVQAACAPRTLGSTVAVYGDCDVDVVL